MKTLKIQQKLEELGVKVSDISLGHFDSIGEFTAKRNREPGNKLFDTVGAFYRSNYERGILIYYLIVTGNLDSFLEIGFGRGYSTMCAAKAFADLGKTGRITTIDPSLNRDYVQSLARIFPEEWFKGIVFVTDKSEDALPRIPEKFDLVYVDGDHRYDAVKRDWELLKDKWSRHILFDDYHLPTKKEEAIECARAIDEIDESQFDSHEKQLIKMDRRIFMDERGYTDDQIDYGQVLMTRKKPLVEESPEEAYVSEWLNDK
jgi:predicted O-methyltransferase YrrM